jgi:NADH-quinone oxidoreductase subunit M
MVVGGSFQWIEYVPWMEEFSLHYHLGADGLSMSMVWLTSLVVWLSVCASKSIQNKHLGFYVLVLLLQTGIMGVFLSLNLFLFYIFWELTLLPLYFLIGIWGGERREYAAIKFFIYTVVGSVFILLALLCMYFYSGLPTFDWVYLSQNTDWVVQSKKLLLGMPMPKVLFVALFFGFAIKVPVFPLHTWLPDAHVQAPTPVSMILAGVLLKMGVYGIVRVVYGVLPQLVSWFAPMLMVLAVINLIYGGLCAMYQKDLKKVIAYSSISHMGYCLMGMASLTLMGLQGAMLQMISHGLISVLLFLLVGQLYQKTNTRQIGQLGGLVHVLPNHSFAMFFAIMACIGLPGLFGFVSEFQVLMGTFSSQALVWDTHLMTTIFGTDGFFTVMSAIGSLTIVLTAVYLLWTFQRVYLGPAQPQWSHLQDAKWSQRWLWLPLIILIVWFGIAPAPIIEWVGPSVEQMLGQIQEYWVKR